MSIRWAAVGDWYEISTDGQVWSHRISRPMRTAINCRTGYEMVTLLYDGRPKHKYVHRLMLEAFVGPCPDGMETRHLDDVKTRNVIENLAWGTRLEQAADRARFGTARGGSHHLNRGEGNGRAILTREKVAWLKGPGAGLPEIEAAAALGVAKTTVRNIRNGYRWAHVPASSAATRSASA